MKKIFLLAAVMLMALAGCNKTPKPTPGPGPGPDGPEDETNVNPIEIRIDGDFSDWDAITEAVCKENDFVDMKKGAAGDPVLVIKTSSDADNVYLYAEVLAEALPQNAISGEWGDSYNGVAGWDGDGDNDSSSEVFNVFFDPDGNDRTGFYTYPSDEDEDAPAIPGLGCEFCSQFFMFYNYNTNKVGVAWEQTNVGPTIALDEEGNPAPYDYTGSFFQETIWNAEGTVYRYGWQYDEETGELHGDNVLPRPENFKTATVGTVCKMEFTFEKKDIVNLEDDDTDYAWGICFRFDTYIQDIGPVSASYSE